MMNVDKNPALQAAIAELDKYDLSTLLLDFKMGMADAESILTYVYRWISNDYRDAVGMFTIEEFAAYLNSRYNLAFREHVVYKSYIPEEIIKIK